MALIDDLAEHWREKGKVAIDIVFHNRPVDYLRIQTSILPKELLFENKSIADADDAALDAMETFWSAVDRGEIKIVENKQKALPDGRRSEKVIADGAPDNRGRAETASRVPTKPGDDC